jgi:hypothetical protein
LISGTSPLTGVLGYAVMAFPQRESVPTPPRHDRRSRGIETRIVDALHWA